MLLESEVALEVLDQVGLRANAGVAYLGAEPLVLVESSQEVHNKGLADDVEHFLLEHRKYCVVSQRRISCVHLKMQGKNVLFATALTLAISWGIYGQKDVGASGFKPSTAAK